MPFSTIWTLLLRVPIPAEHQLKLLSPFVRSFEAYKNSTTAQRISLKFNTIDFHEKKSIHISFGKNFTKQHAFCVNNYISALIPKHPNKKLHERKRVKQQFQKTIKYTFYFINYNIFCTFSRDKTDTASTFPKFEIEESINRSYNGASENLGCVQTVYKRDLFY